MIPQVAGVFTIREDQYEKALELMSDSYKLPKTFSVYKKRLESVVEIVERKGIRAVKIEADMDGFRKWCIDAGRDCDERARVAFANEAVAARLRAGL